MNTYSIISMETFESYTGKINKGDEINKIQANNFNEARQWAYDQYGPMGENIRHKIIEVTNNEK